MAPSLWNHCWWDLDYAISVVKVTSIVGKKSHTFDLLRLHSIQYQRTVPTLLHIWLEVLNNVLDVLGNVVLFLNLRVLWVHSNACKTVGPRSEYQSIWLSLVVVAQRENYYSGRLSGLLCTLLMKNDKAFGYLFTEQLQSFGSTPISKLVLSHLENFLPDPRESS